MSEYEGKVHAVEFPEGLQWINTDRPLTLKDLRGKVVLLDFWTYCCINCMHVIPDLKRLEAKYKDELVVIGVHSAKFKTERETDNIRQAVLRYEIEHPVVNDYEMILWRQYGVRAWPTLILIDPVGKVIGGLSGEGIYRPFDEVIGNVIKHFDSKGLINRKPLNLALEKSRTPNSILSFPGKVLASPDGKRLFIADSNHNRIVIVSLPDGTVLDVAGSGQMGMDDGSFEKATFNHPQGMALDGDILYVADTENHAIRQLDLAKRTVITIAGTGEQARQFNRPGIGTSVALNSPWDLVLHKGILYIAMAGPHQIWLLGPQSRQAMPYAGTGREARIDGPLLASALAQPSGITTDGKKLYFADSETSSIRSADLDPNGNVETIVGVDLFEFGDRDGTGSQARLQHPLGVVYHDGVLYTADTYNNKIKKIFPETRKSVTYLGTGEAGLRDGDKPLFDEPGGLTVANGKLYIADTNNHVIRVADLKTNTVSTLQLKGLEKLRPSMAASAVRGEVIRLDEQTVAAGDATLKIDLQLPEGYKLNLLVASQVTVSAGAAGVQFKDGASQQTISDMNFPLAIPVKLQQGSSQIKIDLVLYYCEEKKDNLCYFKEAQFEIPVKAVSGAGIKQISVSYSVSGK